MQHNQSPLQQSFFFLNPNEWKQEFMEQMFSLVAILATDRDLQLLHLKKKYMVNACILIPHIDYSFNMLISSMASMYI